jgi:hypothetical protein
MWEQIVVFAKIDKFRQEDFMMEDLVLLQEYT